MTPAFPHTTEQPCPLCHTRETQVAHHQTIGGAAPLVRAFVQCLTCELVFVPRRFHLSREQERAVYDQHENHSDDVRYRAFLSRLVTPLRRELRTGDRGLDFGCGPGPTLSTMMRELGVECVDYDPFFHNDSSLLRGPYDFIASSEVFEHLSAPGRVIGELSSMLASGGWLGVMTKRLLSVHALANWHYIRDPTHVAFFGDATFAWMGDHFGFDVHLVSPDVVLMQRITNVRAVT